MSITAAMVKELRERTGAGMMECKRALTESQGNIEAAIEAMRKSGQAKAAKKAGRIAAEGLIAIEQNAEYTSMVEVNCETDFVSKGDDFASYCTAVAKAVLNAGTTDTASLMTTALDSGKTVEEAREDMIAKIGENINVRRAALMPVSAGSYIAAYLHGSRIGVLVNMQGGSEALAKDIAMHIAASRPICVSDGQVPSETIEKEREIYTAQAAESGKPPEIVAKMVDGRVKKFLKELTLLGQPFVKDPDQTVEKLLKSQNAEVLGFERFEVGEGIEKKTENFAEEVMQQVKGA